MPNLSDSHHHCGGAQTRPLPWKLKWPLGRNQRALTALWLEEAIARHCSSLRSMTSTALKHRSFKWTCCTDIFDDTDISFSEISQPCFDPVVVAGVCITSKYFFVKIMRGNLSDRWRLDSFCTKSVNNINFKWINKKVGSGNPHMGFFFQVMRLSSR